MGQTDNRDSHFYFALYWAQALGRAERRCRSCRAFRPVAKALAENEAEIIAELAAAQGKPADLGGYYHTDEAKTAAVMRPSQTFVDILA